MPQRVGVVLLQRAQQRCAGEVTSVLGGHQPKGSARAHQPAGRVGLRGLRLGDHFGGVGSRREMVREVVQRGSPNCLGDPETRHHAHHALVVMSGCGRSYGGQFNLLYWATA
jgi:hypothetical protein